MPVSVRSVLAQAEAGMQCARQELLGGILWVVLVAENGVLQISGFKLQLSGPLHSGPGKYKPHLPERVRTLKGCRPRGGPTGFDPLPCSLVFCWIHSSSPQPEKLLKSTAFTRCPGYHSCLCLCATAKALDKEEMLVFLSIVTSPEGICLKL